MLVVFHIDSIRVIPQQKASLIPDHAQPTNGQDQPVRQTISDFSNYT